MRLLHPAAIQPHSPAAHRLRSGAARLEEARAPGPAVDSEPVGTAVLVAAHRISGCRRNSRRRCPAGRSSAPDKRAATSRSRANARPCPASPAPSSAPSSRVERPSRTEARAARSSRAAARCARCTALPRPASSAGRDRVVEEFSWSTARGRAQVADPDRPRARGRPARVRLSRCSATCDKPAIRVPDRSPQSAFAVSFIGPAGRRSLIGVVRCRRRLRPNQANARRSESLPTPMSPRRRGRPDRRRPSISSNPAPRR